MISIHGEEFKPGGKIRLTPRDGYKRKYPSLERDLRYGHVCPTCNNVILASFETDKEINLWPYEETTVLSQGEKNMGEILKIFPDAKAKLGDSCYNISMLEAGGKKAQFMYLKNHILRKESIRDRNLNDADKLWEVGERTCPMTGVFSTWEEGLIKDLCLLFRIPAEDLKNYNVKKVSDLIPDRTGAPTENKYFRWTPAIGVAPPVVLVSRENVNHGYPFWLQGNLLKPFKIIVNT